VIYFCIQITDTHYQKLAKHHFSISATSVIFNIL